MTNGHPIRDGDSITRQRTLAETQTAGFGLNNGDVIEFLVMEFDDDHPAITVRHDRVSHPDPMSDSDGHETETVTSETVLPTTDIQRKIEIGTRHGQDRVIITGHNHAPRAYIRHEQRDGGWTTQATWEIHPATGISQVSGEPMADGGTVTERTQYLGVGRCPEHGLVTEDDGATVQFPTIAKCHCGRALERATVVDAKEVRNE